MLEVNMNIRNAAWVFLLLAAAGVARAAEQGFCEMKITGDRTVSFREPKVVVTGSSSYDEQMKAARVSAASDRWLSEGHIRTMLSATSRVTGKNVEEAMKKDPRLFALTMTCSNEAVTLTFLPAAGSKYADVPFGPKKYVITDSKVASGAPGFGNQGKPGEFVVSAMMVKSGSEKLNYATSAPGVLDITSFDAKGVKGTFSFKAVQRYAKPGENISVSGSFSLPCEGDICR
jgi:hypothetical protein